MKKRIDLLLVEKEFFPSREQASRAVRAGWVKADGIRIDKPGKSISDQAKIELSARPCYVSRGGDKLAGALKDFSLEVKGFIVLDAGVSTGGFTDCLLQKGVCKVYAFDVGRGQLAWKLRQDDRVILRERFNVRYLKPDDLPEKVDLVVADLSFISLTKVLKPLFAQLKKRGLLLVLIKPQFEARPSQVKKGGVVRDPQVREETVNKVVSSLKALGSEVLGTAMSHLKGPAGNVEFFVLARKK